VLVDKDKWILGRKVGMTQVFDDQGRSLVVTVLRAGPCVVVQRRVPARDGYSAVQVGFEEARTHKVNKPMSGHFAKAKVKPLRVLREFRCANPDQYEPGQEITVDVFSPGDAVDVTGTSKGKGFAGVIKRWGFSRGPMGHGSKYHRRVGSLQGRAASRVFKNRKLPGRMGGAKVTAQNLSVVRVDPEHNLLVLEGAVPGPRGGLVTVKAGRWGRRSGR
jgi:large subunit ribosomal protein L3